VAQQLTTGTPGSALESFRRIRRLELGHWPTPLLELARLREHLGCKPRLWVKHDDWAGPGFGGNKVRKLEYYFAKALAQGYDTVITCGSLRSNHCRVTAALAARLGLECHLVLNGASAGTPASLWLCDLFGAHVRRIQSRDERAVLLERTASELRTRGRRPMVIPLGASTALGALGFVNAAQELISQCSKLGFRPDWVVHSTSSGGTQAGLIAGFRLHGENEVHVLGVSADEPASAISQAVQTLLAQIEIDLGAAACSLTGDIFVNDKEIGGGYGESTPAGEEATRLLARLEGIVLDPVYSAKAMAGLLGGLKRWPLSETNHIIFWHTGGQMALFQRE
jgi:1-aminocyclopropane-1-carboxylate deaminase/D-cysteine desulfhydrase-like pyridoxal-dependent ACC family enzyme